MISTSSHNNCKTDKYQTYAISGNRGKNAGYTGKCYPKLAPKLSFWQIWENNIGLLPEEENNKYYIEEYYNQVLSKLNPEEIYQELDNSILLCYEDNTQFCHRHIVAEWFEISLNIKVPEIIVKDDKIIEVDRPKYIKEYLEEAINKHKKEQIKKYEEEATKLLNQIEEEKHLTTKVLMKVASELGIYNYEVFGPINDGVLYQNWTNFLQASFNVYKYKYFISDLIKDVKNYYNSKSKGFRTEIVPKINNKYCKALFNQLFLSHIWITYDEVYKPNKYSNVSWKLENIKYSIEPKENYDCVPVGITTPFIAKEHIYTELNTASEVYEIISKRINSKEFQIEYYQNYCKSLKEIIEEYKRVRLYLQSIKSKKTKGPSLKRKRVGAKAK